MAFTISQGEVSQAQNDYQKIFENILKELLQASEEKPEIQGLEIFKDNKIIYGPDGKNFVNNITGIEGEIIYPQFLETLKKLRNSPVGSIIPEAKNIKVYLDDEIIIKSDKEGKVTKNSLQENINNHMKSENIEPDYNFVESDLESELNSQFQEIDKNIKENIDENTNSTRTVSQSIEPLDENILSSKLDSKIQELDNTIDSAKSVASQARENIKGQIRQDNNIKSVNTKNNQSIQSNTRMVAFSNTEVEGDFRFNGTINQVSQNNQTAVNSNNKYTDNNSINNTNDVTNLESPSTDNIKSGIKDLKSPIREDLYSEIKAIRQDCENFQAQIRESQQIINNAVEQLNNSIEKLRHYQDIQKHSSSAVQSSVETGNETEKDNIIQTSHNQKENNISELEYPKRAIDADFSTKGNQRQNQDIPETSSTRIMSATESLEKPLKSLINSELEKLQLEIKLLREERDAYKAILKERVRNGPEKIAFWQDLKSDFSQIATDMKSAIELFNTNSNKQEYAKGLVKLFHNQSKDNTYEGKNYRITKENGIYTVNAINDNRKVMQFRSTITGTKIIEDNLNEKDIQALKNLKDYVKKIPHTKQSNIIPTSFQEFGESESKRFIAINNIADTLSEYAKSKGHPVSIQGKRSDYNWQADLKGNVTIEHKNKVILQIKDGHTYDAMEPRDITFFQNSLPALQKIIKQGNTQNSNHTSNSSTNLLKRIRNLAQTIHNITQSVGRPINLNGKIYSIKSDKDNIQILRRLDNKLIFNYSHKTNQITDNFMTIKDVSQIENKLKTIELPRKQQNHQKSNNKGLSLE